MKKVKRKGKVNNMEKLKVGIIGATGFVGQRFVTLLEDHPWFEVTTLAASSRSAGKTYEETMNGRWKIAEPMPKALKDIVVKNAADIDDVASNIDFCFCAVDMNKDDIKTLEETYAKREIPVVSNNSAHRWTPDVPVIVPELNPMHSDIISTQRKRLGTNVGFVTAKPNCSIQSYVPAIHPLMDFEPLKLMVSTYQAISGSGKVFADWPEIMDNVIPYIGGEEEKSEQEPLRIWGSIEGEEIVKAHYPMISAHCYRVPVSDGHMASVSVTFKDKPEIAEILSRWENFKGLPQELELPSAPKQFLRYIDEQDRPQSKLDRDYEKGMGVTIGRLREGNLFQYKFACLSHNTIRGAAGGAILTAELLKAQGYIVKK